MSKVFIIAEIGQAHEGSLGILHSYIDAVAGTGADAIKFQTHIAEAESSEYEPFRVNFSYEDKSRYDYWDRMSFSLSHWQGIKAHCDDVGLEFLSSPFSCAAVDLLEQVGVERYKIGSGEITNFLLLEKIAQTGKEIILSSGMSSFLELDDAIRFVQKFGNKLSLMQCTTKYPTRAEDVGLNVLTEMQHRYKLPIGLSDHSGQIYPGLSAVTLGAQLIEVHTVFDKSMFGPDSKSSLSIAELKSLVEGVRFTEKAVATKVDKHDNSQFQDVKAIFEKSLAINKDKKAGEILTVEDLEGKKPFGYGIPAREYKCIIGRTLTKDLSRWDFITEEALNE